MSSFKFEICDITQVADDAIVNAANKTLLGGGGVDGAIHRAAGPKLLEECRGLNGCDTGEAKITRGYNLPSDFVIHTVGPIYSGTGDDATQLADCYQNSLDLAAEHNLHSVAFSAISTGIYHFPLDKAAKISLSTVSQWLVDHPNYQMDVLFTCFDNRVYDSYSDYVEKYSGENEFLQKMKY